ncbi:MAG TPA: glycosyltransferase family 2 protein [Gaiellales bacterium]|jgi:glycosyltransferase involved in cell wall biosynthesis|nr:glycosyltransferase family 2 protein [Gaiellales bacterium]
MASDPVLAGAADPAAAATPDVTVVVPVLNEEATLQPLYDGVTATLEAAGIAAELIFVDDGSTDGTFAILERLHDADPRVRVVSFKRNFGQHPAMHAGIARARGRIVVTMDGDLQNQPADITRLIAAVDAGADVASGRRVTRKDPIFLRRLPSLVINKLLARLTGAQVADFGCAFNAYRRDALEPVMHRIGRQKFTKALVCSTGARVTEVDLDHRARADRSRYGVVSLVKLALHVLTGFWAQLVQWLGTILGVLGILTSLGVGLWGVVYWIRNDNFPGPLLLGGLVLFVLGLQGFLMAVVGENLQRIQRDVEGRPLYYIERELG